MRAKEQRDDSKRRTRLNLLRYEAIKRELFLLIIAIGTACSGYCPVTFSIQPDTVTGDIVFILHLKEHLKFKRKQDHLYVEHNVSLTETLCGLQFVLTHLDGRQLLIKINPGEVIKPDQYKGSNDEGVPQYQRPFMKGKLVIHFNVSFPETGALTPKTI